MRVVVDTNVVVSAILRDRLPEKVWLFIIGQPDFEWVAAGEILTEYREVLRRPKFALPAATLAAWDERFRSAIAEWPVEIPGFFSARCERREVSGLRVGGGGGLLDHGRFRFQRGQQAQRDEARFCQPVSRIGW